MRPTALNRIQLLPTVASDLLESCFHRSERSLILVDTVGVTGSIPVSRTSMFSLVRRPVDDHRRRAVFGLWEQYGSKRS